jgi:hypothetical protein
MDVARGPRLSSRRPRPPENHGEELMKDFKIIPEICVDDARGAIAFYKKAFGAKDLGTHATPTARRSCTRGSR